MNLELLEKEIPYKWKTQTASQYGCQCVAYIDARDVQNILDEAVGKMNWRTSYTRIGHQLFCTISIYDKDKQEWVSKTDTGTESMTEKEKGEVSDAFKRAGVCWGIGRFLYSMKIQKVDSIKNTRGKFEPAFNGKKIWDLTKHINSLPGGYTPAQKTPEHKPTEGRYNASKGGANVQYTKVTYSEDTISKVKALEKDGKKGSDVLKDYLTKYNEAKKTSFKLVSELSEAQLQDLVKFVENSPPANL